MPVPEFVTTGAAAFSTTAFALVFLLLSLALGRRVSLWFGVSHEDPILERGLVALGLGIGVLEGAILALGACGILSVQSVRITIVVLLVVAARDGWAVIASAGRLVTARRPVPGWLVAWAIVLVPGLAVAYLLAVTPALDPDGLGYHLTVVKRWLTLGTFAFLPTYTYANMPMGVEALFAIAMSFSGDAAAKVLHYSLSIAGTVTVYLAGKRLQDSVVAAGGAALYLFGPFGVGGIMGAAYVEGALSFAVMASVLAWLVWFANRRVAWLRVSFALAGIAVSFKITAALFPMGLMLLTWWIEWYEAPRERRAVASILLRSWPLVILTAIPVAPWILRATVITGNPIFPMFGTVIPSRDFPPELSAEWDLYFRYLNWGTGAGSWSLDTRKNILLVSLLVVAVLAGMVFAIVRSSIARATTVVVGAMMLLQVLAVGLYKRHWTAVMSVVQLLAVAQFVRMLPSSARWPRTAVIILTAALSLASARTNLRAVGGDVRGTVWTALGVKPQRDFLAQHLPLFTLYEHANRQLPPDAGVAFDFGCGGFHIDRKTFCLEIPQASLRVDSWEVFVEDARRLGLTHVIAPRELASGDIPQFPGVKRSGPGFTFKERTDKMLVRLLSTHGRLLAAAADQGLYAVDLNRP